MLNIKPGIYLVDKPSGPSSHNVVNYFRKISGIKRIGHCGTLDPLASGLLIILVDRAFTKTQNLYLKQDKEYLVEVRFGLTTDSYDQTGQITQQIAWDKLQQLTKSDILGTLSNFTGKIRQTVPSFSAVKVHGEKLYQKARRGQSVILPIRSIEIKKLSLIHFKKDVKKQEISCQLLVNCSSGTYIRSLVHDLGRVLKTGAMVTALRRTKIGKFHVKKAIKLNWDNQLGQLY